MVISHSMATDTRTILVNKNWLKQVGDVEYLTELFNAVPTAYNIDEYIINLNTKMEKENIEITIERLEKEVNFFIECAYDDLYARPNKIISKKYC